MRAIVFIHGAGGSGLLFGRQFQAFRDRAHCYFLDLPGHGQSPNPHPAFGSPPLKHYADTVIEFLGSLNVPATLLGHSMYGAVAIDVALARADLLEGLILVGTGCHLPVSDKILTGLETGYEDTLDKIVRYCFSKSVAPG